MPITFTRKGYIRLLRDGTQISQHSVAEEAYENAIAHAEAHGPGRYVVRYPDREIDVGVFVLRSPTTSSSPVGAAYYGYTPSVYAAPADVGNGSGTSEANAMDLATALSTATPGAIIGCIPGTYTGTAGAGRFTPAWQSASGTAGNPVRIVAKHQAITLATPGTDGNRCELAHTGSSAFNDANSSPIFGCSGDDYVEWYGFYCDERTSYSHADTGPVVLYDATGCKIVNCYIQGGTSTWTDNHCGIRSEETDDCSIENNIIRDIQTSGSPNGVNVVGIQTYDSRNLTVSHNTIFDCKSGIFFKGIQNGVTLLGQHDITCTYNKIYGITHSGIAAGITDGGTNVVAYNLIYGAGTFGLRIRADALTGENWDVHHNTVDFTASTNANGVVNNSNTLAWGDTVRDNIFVVQTGDVTASLVEASARTSGLPTFSYNRYYAVAGTPYFNFNGGSDTTLNDWQTGVGNDTGSTYGDPSFTNRAGAVYTLAGGSACLTASSTGGPVGCYITGTETIGVIS